eukprot:2714886-Prymnesium_polylepis.1
MLCPLTRNARKVANRKRACTVTVRRITKYEPLWPLHHCSSHARSDNTAGTFQPGLPTISTIGITRASFWILGATCEPSARVDKTASTEARKRGRQQFGRPASTLNPSRKDESTALST